MSLLKKIFGSRNDRVIRRLTKTVAQINTLEPNFKALTDDQLKAKTAEFRARFANGATLDDLLPEAFACVREASSRVLGLRHFDVQLIGGMVLHQGKIAEMRTGEGKTLMATLAAYLNALSGKGVHVITVNDYLARRDNAWMAPIFEFLQMTTGVIVHGLNHTEKQEAYRADITYGTNNEFGFDYLRDNMAYSLDYKVQKPLNFAIIDEVDSILIDEARTPLIISGSAEESSELYRKINGLIPLLKKREQEGEPGDYYLDEKGRLVFLTEAGHEHIEKLLVEREFLGESESLYAASNITLMHHVMAALKAHALYQRDVDYIVQNNEILIVDEHTGRAMPGRRWSEGLHQAIEAKENVSIQNENHTLATITFQNFFRLYNKLSGMTGTADTEAYEFQQIYGLEVVVIPTHREMIRIDNPDLVYLNARDKYLSAIEDIKECVTLGRPVLVGTASIEASELLSKLLTQDKIPHQVLNAKFHEKEAHIIAQAGRPSAVTIATNMAGRGTDIVLGGNLEAELAGLSPDADENMRSEVKALWQQRHDQVVAAGGLHIIGSERHESRRIDNQLRGRAGRQGDPGSSRFYLSLEDNLIRIFASERMAGIMQRLGMEEGVALESGMLTRTIENAQRKVEGRNFDIRKQLLEYDNVANEQRKVIYDQRDELLASDDVSNVIEVFREDVIDILMSRYMPAQDLEENWDLPTLEMQLATEFAISTPIQTWFDAEPNLEQHTVRTRILDALKQNYHEKSAMVPVEGMRQFEKSVMLQLLDNLWKDHLAAMDYLRQGIHLRGYAQKNPKQEYKREAFHLFSQMLDRYKHEVVSTLGVVKIEAEAAAPEKKLPETSYIEDNLQYHHDDFGSILQPPAPEPQNAVNEFNGESSQVSAKILPFVRDGKKVGRNDSCPCGSGKKYKHCHGQLIT